MDDLIYYTHSQRLFESIGASAKIAHYPDHMTHNDFDYHDDIIQPVLEFLLHIKFNSAPNDEFAEIKIPESLYEYPNL
jgi:hypothetical protein